MPSDAYRAILDTLWAQERAPGVSLAEQRANYDAIGDQYPPPADVNVEDAVGAPVPSIWVRAPEAATDGALVWFHGGGYVIGSPHGYRRLAADLGRATGLQALVPDYRLAPEHPHPAAVEDAVATYRWLLDGGLAPERIVVGGDSAGGGLAVATLVALRDGGVPLPGAAALLSPWTDLSLSSSTWTSRAELDPLVGVHNAPDMAKAYLAGQPVSTPLASPIHAELSGLPPLLILVGDHEVLLDDARALAQLAKGAGVAVILEEYPELHHVWPVFTPDTVEGIEAVAMVSTFWRRHLGR